MGATLAGRSWWDLSLTSGWFVTLVLLLAIIVTVSTAVTWDVDRFKRTRRASLLVASQTMAVLAMAVMANIAGGFYGHLSELLGGTADAGPVMQAGTQHDGRRGDPGQAPAIEPWLAEARKQSGNGKGVWTSMTIAGSRTKYSMPAWLYVPDAYFAQNSGNRRFPVSILLAGFPGAVENWERQGHMVALLDKLMADGTIPPMILVSVSQNQDDKHDSECVDAPGGFQADTYITQDATEVISSHLRVTQDRAGWSIMGYSTGGYCAVNLAMRHPKQFSAAASLDGYFAPKLDATTGDLFKQDAALQRANTPAQTIHERRDQPLRFYLLAGDAEAKVRTEANTFAASVTAPDQATVAGVSGGHNWTTWMGGFQPLLVWLAKGLPADGGRSAQSSAKPA